MFLEIIVTISAVILLNIYLTYRFIKRYAPENLVIEIISMFSLGIYIAFVFYNIYIPALLQILLLFTMFFLPCFAVLLQINNIILTRKVLYYKIKWNMYNHNYILAKKMIYKLIEMAGRKAEYYYMLGLCYKSLKDHINSRDSFMLATEYDKRDYLSYYELGKILDETNKKDNAVIMFNNALRIKPDFYEAAESLGISYTSQAKYEEAIVVYKNALEYHINSYELHYNIAMLELEIGNLESSEESFKKAANLNPKLYSAYYNIGSINYFKGEYDKAVEFFKLARSSTMYGGQAYYRLATVYAADKAYDKAMSCLEYAILIDRRYINESKSELVFENIKDRINAYADNIQILDDSKKDKYDYLGNIGMNSREKEELDAKISIDIEKEKRQELVKVN